MAPGIVIKPEDVQIGRGATLPHPAIRGVEILEHGKRRNDRVGSLTILVDTAISAANGIPATSHRIDIQKHETSGSWVLSALVENAGATGIALPDPQVRGKH